jgi:hypothetical protein
MYRALALLWQVLEGAAPSPLGRGGQGHIESA